MGGRPPLLQMPKLRRMGGELSESVPDGLESEFPGSGGILRMSESGEGFYLCSVCIDPSRGPGEGARGGGPLPRGDGECTSEAPVMGSESLRLERPLSMQCRVAAAASPFLGPIRGLRITEAAGPTCGPAAFLLRRITVFILQ
jgi:hypothetical protein